MLTIHYTILTKLLLFTIPDGNFPIQLLNPPAKPSDSHTLPSLLWLKMCARVDFIYSCFHHLSLEGDDIPHWIMVEFQSGFDIENNRWVGMWYENGNISIDDICMACKEEIHVREQQRKAELAAEKKMLTEKGHGKGEEATNNS